MKNTQAIKANAPGHHKLSRQAEKTKDKNERSALSDHHLAFDNSLQANVICTVDDDKIIRANLTACKLFGYSKKELLTKGWQDLFDTKEAGFKKMFKQITANAQAKAFTSAIKKNGKQFPAEITSVIFADLNNVYKSITTIVDRSVEIRKQKKIDDRRKKVVSDDIIIARLKSDTRLAENNEWIKYIAQTSYDVMWDWDLATNMIYVGDSVKEVFGYKLPNNQIHFKDWSRCLHPAEKNKVEKKLFRFINSGQKNWRDSFRFLRNDGSLATTKSRASIIRNDDGTAIRMIGAIQDVSSLQDLEKKLSHQVDLHEILRKEQEEKYLLTAKVSFDVIWDWNLLNDQLFIGDGFEEMFGYKIQNNIGSIEDWTGHIHPEDKEDVKNKIQSAIESCVAGWEYAYRFKKADGSMVPVMNRGSIIRDPDGKAFRIIGAMQDISVQTKLETNLEREVIIKEKLLSASHLKQLLFENTVHANLVTDGKGNILEVNSTACHMFGYTAKELIEKGRQGILDSTDGRLEKWVNERDRTGNMNGELTGIKKDGTKFPCEISSVLFKIETGESRAILTIIDISKRIRLQKDIDTKKEKLVNYNIILAKSESDIRLAENNERQQARFNLAEEILWDLNVETNIVSVSDAYEKQFGHKITDNMTPAIIWTSHIHPDDKEDLIKDLYRALGSADTKWEYRYRFLSDDGSVVDVISRSIIQRDEEGRAYRVMGLMTDLGREKELEEQLDMEILLKEQQIEDAVVEARKLERSDIGKELHDNVNQLLSASSLYIDMAKEDGANREMYLRRSHEYTITAIEEIRKLSKGLVTDIIKDIGLAEAISTISKDTMEVHPVKITCVMNNFVEARVNNKFKLNVYRIIQEQLNNIVKHARASVVKISFSQNKKIIQLSISDNGIGFDTTKKSKGIGLANINSRAEFYKVF